ncbi:conserved protein of unknown function [Acetoanaerobium sticklandii]|uniref:Twitching motility protein PilT n=1 Tax=Acetoanaerobium sticklandii (strain ATCC 12662 / DSM 519 / JCM 1433 / CCUG 9281 / NCIMB 10654 / HF) TaxID=499177 RepID=E3PRH9_ACESD|nr:hypothetical protein [Acetoanaerobium sticklandii]CBH21483.1 conserved protein of unknown function [Acetoanaerobium sticklandii]
MVKLLIGEAGSGKTKAMIQMANESIELVKGELVYIESSSKHMHQLHRDIRFISTQDFNLDTFSSIYGFICGLVSENYDIEKIFIDGLDKIINPLSADLISFIDGIDKLSDKHEFEIIISASIYDQAVLEKVQKYSHNYEKVSL